MRMRSEPVTPRVYFVLGVMLVLMQRLAIPAVGQSIPVNLLVVGAFITWGVVRRDLVLAPRPFILWSAFIGCAAFSTLLSDEAVSLPSLLQVAAYWFVLTFRSRRAHGAFRIIDGFVAASVLAAVFSFVQVGVGLNGGAFVDPLGGLDSRFRIEGYNTTYNVGALWDWDKANGGVFLEPSFLSLGCALSIVLIAQGAALRGVRWSVRFIAMALLLGGVLASTALSGLVVLPFLIFEAIRHLRTAAVTAVLLILAGVVFQSLEIGRAYLLRLGTNGSNDARLVRPYLELLPMALGGGPIFGAGAGVADDVARRLTGGSWTSEVTAPTLVKLIYEYGLIGLVLLMALLITGLAASHLPVASRVAIAIVLLVPTNALVNPLITTLTLVLVATSSTVTARSEGERAVKADALTQTLTSNGLDGRGLERRWRSHAE